jgi:hypothetical protein
MARRIDNSEIYSRLSVVLKFSQHPLAHVVGSSAKNHEFPVEPAGRKAVVKSGSSEKIISLGDC